MPSPHRLPMNGKNPLPSLLRAEADGDYATLDRLVSALYGHGDSSLRWLRFVIASDLEDRGEFTADSDCSAMLERIEAEVRRVVA